MADDPREPDWPLRFTTLPDGTVQLADVAQGTPEAREASAAVVMSVPRGHRDDKPAFGVTDLRFQQGTINVERLVAELAQSDPALEGIDADEVIKLADARTRLLTVNVGDTA